MDIIAKVNLRVDDMALTHKVLTEGLGFTGSPSRTMSRYRMDSNCEVLVYRDPEVFRESPTHVGLIVTPEKITKVANILKESGAKHVIYRENVGDGVINTLDWSMEDASSLRLESLEDDYWENK